LAIYVQQGCITRKNISGLISMVEYLFIEYLAVFLLSSLMKSIPTKTIKMTKTSASVCLALDMALSSCAYAIFWFDSISNLKHSVH